MLLCSQSPSFHHCFSACVHMCVLLLTSGLLFPTSFTFRNTGRGLFFFFLSGILSKGFLTLAGGGCDGWGLSQHLKWQGLTLGEHLGWREGCRQVCMEQTALTVMRNHVAGPKY